MSIWSLRGVAAATVFALAGGCVYESFEEPVTFVASNNDTDGGNNTSNTTVNNVTTPDMGTTPDDMGTNNSTSPDMGMTEPWRCPRKLIADGASDTTEIQIESLGDDNFIVTWPLNLDGARVVTVDLDGTIGADQQYSGLIEANQRVELITDGTANHHIWLAEASGLKLLDCNANGCTETTSSLGPVDRVDGFWNGGDEVPYVASFTDKDQIEITVDQSGDPAVGRVTPSADPSWISLALTEIPPNPQATSPFMFGFVEGGAIYTASRPDSGIPIALTAEDCGEEVANVGKVFATGNSETEVVGDIDDGGDTVVARIDCGSNTTELTSPLTGLEDWDIVSYQGGVRVFHATQDGLNQSQYDGRITNIEMDGAQYTRVAAVRTESGVIAVVTIDAEGLVQMRTMDSSGTCL